MSQVPPNIQRFNLTALRLFSELYDAFPNTINIETAMLGAESAPEELPAPDALAYAMGADEVLTWLAEEGFIRIAGGNLGTEVHGVRLTLKGLTILGYVLTALKTSEASEPMIDKIKRTLGSGAEKAGAEAVKALLGGVFRLAISYGSSGGTAGINV